MMQAHRHRVGSGRCLSVEVTLKLCYDCRPSATEQLRPNAKVPALDGSIWVYSIWVFAMAPRKPSRRRVLLLAGGAFATRAVGRASAQGASDPVISDQLASDILYEESEGGKQLVGRTLIKPFWFERAAGTRSSPTWPTDNVSFDYAHLVAQPNSEEVFQLTPAVLQQLLALNSFRPDPQLPRLLFGLRGCVLANNADVSQWSDVHQVRATRPNHMDPKCLIGVWDPANKTIALFKGSTVPNVDLMEKQIEGSLGCNMMPTGLHHYQVGAHRAPRQPGAFRQQVPLWVIRTKKRLYYAANDPDTVWDDLNGDLPFDDIHAAMLSSRKKPPFFSSAGCQVIAGAYDADRLPTGAWAEFRKAAGLGHPIEFVGSSATKDDGRHFNYCLLTGKDAHLVASGAASSVRALRYGSSGEAVVDLQEKLASQPAGAGIDKTGVLDRKTLGAVIRWQVEKKIAPTGTIAAAAATSLGLKWS
jgi:hypothetical protein